MLTGVYVDRDSVLHRAPPWVKLVGLVALSVALFAVRSPVSGVVAAVVAVGLYGLARVGVRAAWAQLRPLRIFVPVLFVVQWLLLGPAAAVWLTTRLVLLVALAGLVTLTTRTSELMAVIERALGPLRRGPGRASSWRSSNGHWGRCAGSVSSPPGSPSCCR